MIGHWKTAHLEGQSTRSVAITFIILGFVSYAVSMGAGAASASSQKRKKTMKQIISIAANTKHLYNICTFLAQRRIRWADVVQMLYKCFVFAGIELQYVSFNLRITHWS